MINLFLKNVSVYALRVYLDGELYTWGSNEFGQLGLGLSAANVSKPTLVESLVSLPISFIACGGYHSFIVSKSGT